MALRLALDSNRYVDFCRGDDEAVGVLRRAREVFVPLIVLGELRAGFRRGAHFERNEAALDEFLRTPRVEVLSPDEGTTHAYAELFAELRAVGKPIPTNDLWIAALVWQHDLVLFTRDKHFANLRRLPLI
jgi:tRNA(fMet)-specific endonuclease VapC